MENAKKSGLGFPTLRCDWPGPGEEITQNFHLVVFRKCGKRNILSFPSASVNELPIFANTHNRNHVSRERLELPPPKLRQGLARLVRFNSIRQLLTPRRSPVRPASRPFSSNKPSRACTTRETTRCLRTTKLRLAEILSIFRYRELRILTRHVIAASASTRLVSSASTSSTCAVSASVRRPRTSASTRYDLIIDDAQIIARPRFLDLETRYEIGIGL